MISKQNRILNELQACVYNEKGDSTAFRVNMENVIKILFGHDYIMPARKYEDTVEKALNRLVTKGMKLDPATKYRIAVTMLQIAHAMSLTKEDLINEKIRQDRILKDVK